MSEQQVSLLILEPGEEKPRLVRVYRVPFTVGDSPTADVRIRGAQSPVRLRIDREKDRFLARNLAAVRAGESARGLPLRHGSRIRTGGVRVQFLTSPPEADAEGGGNGVGQTPDQVETAPVRTDPAFLYELVERVRHYLDRVERLGDKLELPPEFLRR